MMFGYFQRSQWSWITAFYRMSKFNFSKIYYNFNFINLVESSINLHKHQILGYLTQKDSHPTTLVRNGWNFHQITITCGEIIFWHSVKGSDSGSLRSLKIIEHHFLTPDPPPYRLKRINPCSIKVRAASGVISACLAHVKVLLITE